MMNRFDSYLFAKEIASCWQAYYEDSGEEGSGYGLFGWGRLPRGIGRNGPKEDNKSNCLLRIESML